MCLCYSNIRDIAATAGESQSLAMSDVGVPATVPRLLQLVRERPGGKSRPTSYLTKILNSNRPCMMRKPATAFMVRTLR